MPVLCLLLSLIGCLGIGIVTGAYGATHEPIAFFARQIAPADCILVTNWADSRFGREGYGFHITGARVKKIVRAVSGAKRMGIQEHPDFEWEWQLRFLSGTNLVGSVYFNKNTFLRDGVWRDRTGCLAELYRDASNREYVARVYKDEDQEFATSKKTEARKGLKNLPHTGPDERLEELNQFVDQFYRAGARSVFLADSATTSEVNRDHPEVEKYLLVVLPQDSKVRRKVFVVHRKAVRAWGIDSDDDVGQKYLWYPIDLTGKK